MSTPLDAKTIKLADDFLDADNQRKRFHELGEQLFGVFGTDKEGRINTQIRNLQQVAVSARRLSDVEDFVKNQAGKTTQAALDWRKVTQGVLEQLALLRQQANALAADEGQRLQLRLHLARGWVRAVVGAYLYQKALTEMKSHA